MNNRKTVLSLSFITSANLWIWVNRVWNSRTQVTQVWQARGISVGWMGNLQCQHSGSSVLNVFTHYVSYFLSILMLIRSPEPGWNRGGKRLCLLGTKCSHQLEKADCGHSQSAPGARHSKILDTSGWKDDKAMTTSRICHLIHKLPRVPSWLC